MGQRKQLILLVFSTTVFFDSSPSVFILVNLFDEFFIPLCAKEYRRPSFQSDQFFVQASVTNFFLSTFNHFGCALLFLAAILTVQVKISSTYALGLNCFLLPFNVKSVGCFSTLGRLSSHLLFFSS